MNKQLCVTPIKMLGIPLVEQLPLIRKAGFDGFFVICGGTWEPEPLMAEAKRQGLFLQSLHGPFGKAAEMWGEDTEAGEAGVAEMISGVEDCARWGAPILVLHVFKGFFKENIPTEIGIERYTRVVERARELGVKIAFENTEGAPYLKALMDTFAGNQTVGFCWDTGHEQCYNYGKDQLSLYGDRLLCTHLNDNMGISDPEGNIGWIDDLHLMPFDGITDWSTVAARLNQHNFAGPLTFELLPKSKPGRHENDIYEALGTDGFFAEAYRRAVRLAEMMEG